MDWKKIKDILVIFLIVLVIVKDKVIGFDVGVNDYFIKFFVEVELFVCICV